METRASQYNVKVRRHEVGFEESVVEMKQIVPVDRFWRRCLGDINYVLSNCYARFLSAGIGV